MNDHDPAARLRLDKWLWAARFFKTRSLAADAVDAGKVRWNGQSVKPARDIKVGDELEIQAAESRWTVIVQGMSGQRRPAAEARTLYRETEESQTRRAEQQEQRKIAPTPGADLKGRPTKRAGRLIRSLGG